MEHGERTRSADLKISCLTPHTWQVAPVSPRARGWLARRDLPDAALAAEGFETDFRQINRLAASARSDGLVIEFNGPHETFHL